MKKISFRSSMALTILVGCLCVANLSADEIKPRKVKTSDTISWRAHQDGLDVSGIDAEVINARLNLFNQTFTVKYRIRGQVRFIKGGWRPYINEAQYTERLVIDNLDPEKSHGDIEIVPIVKVKEDTQYRGEWLPFLIEFEKRVNAFKWGNNRYVLRSGLITSEFSVTQYK